MTWETFPNAPIVEAVLDIRASLPADASLEQVKDMLQAHDGYPHQEDLKTVTSKFEVSPAGVAMNHAQSIVGRMYLSQDRSRIVQARLNGFTVNHLKPYATWRSLVEEARLRWPAYVKAAGPLEVTRLALRYVNHVLLPSEAKVEDYFNVRVSLGQEFPNLVARLNAQVGFHDPASDATVLINYGVQPGSEGEFPVVLDIDVFKETRIEPASDEIWSGLEQLREVKNRVFFAATTEKAKGSFR